MSRRRERRAARAIGPAGGLSRHARPAWLGSEGLAAWTNQTLVSEGAYAPLGEANAGAGAGEQMFTSKGQRLAAGIYDFPFRHYSPAQGRWLSPDPSGLAAVNPADPQTWNEYAYVANQPLTATDPLGLCPDGTVCTPVGAGLYCPRQTCTVHAAPWEETDPEYWLFSFGIEGAAELEQASGGVGGAVSSHPPAVPPTAPPWWSISIRQPGQSFGQCMGANASTYSLGGSFQLGLNDALGTNISVFTGNAGSLLTGNSINSVLFGSASDAGSAMASNAPGGLAASMGTITTYGRRTSDVASLNLPGAGGLPTALGDAAAGTRSFFQTAGDWLGLGMSLTTRLSVDGALAGAEAIDCIAP